MELKKRLAYMKSQPAGRWLRVLSNLFADLALVNVALLLAFGLRYDFAWPDEPRVLIVRYALPASFFALAVFVWRGLYRIRPRYVGVYDLVNISATGLLLSVLMRALVYLDNPEPGILSAWSVPVLFGFFTIMLLCGRRLMIRLMTFAPYWGYGNGRERTRQRTMIVGAGDAGEMVLRELNKMQPQRYEVCCFVDENEFRDTMTIHGIPVQGGIDDIPELAKKHDIEEILVALPEATGQEMRRIFSQCAKTDARIKTLPSFSNLVSGGKNVMPLMREIEVEDLLRRKMVVSDMSPAKAYLGGERVLITGGGGSIGAELARQVAALSPANMILLGKGENSVHEIDQELRHRNAFMPIPVIADVRNKQAITQVFESHYPSIVFHAAAHKHVPLMEAVPIEAIQNNVFGTLNVAELAIQNGVKKFILVSTDKAVNPSNVMGATKRVAEMIVSALGARSETDFASVRFGNVLGSRGSIVPMLKMQIRHGGPVTITHPEMTRYFMTIPEAVQLIVQAGAMGNRGEIFILDMGEPVAIVDMAKEMIRMHGLVPGQDIQIHYTGVRPGEKIHEELSGDYEELEPCDHPKIRTVKNGTPIDWDWLKQQLEELQRICESGDQDKARAFLMELAWGKTILLGTAPS